MTSINPIYHANITKAQISKLKTDEPATVSNPSPQNVSFRGTEALAAYNYARINQDKVFDIPIIKPFNIPTNIDDIKGVRITNSDGVLVRIVDEDNKQKSLYFFRDGKLFSFTKIEKDTGIAWTQGLEREKGEGFFVEKIYPNGENYCTFCKDGKPIDGSKRIVYLNGDELYVSFDAEAKEYFVNKIYSKNGKGYNSFATFDENKKCINAFEIRGLNEKITDLYFKDGIPYNLKTTEAKRVSLITDKDDINLKDLELDENLNIDFEQVKNLEGQKKYYSNGQIEQITTSSGDVYKFGLEGLEKIKMKNKEYIFDRDKDGKIGRRELITDMGNGFIKKSITWEGNGGCVEIAKDGEMVRYVVYNSNGTIGHYADNELDIVHDYDENGNLRDMHRSKYEKD